MIYSCSYSSWLSTADILQAGSVGSYSLRGCWSTRLSVVAHTLEAEGEAAMLWLPVGPNASTTAGSAVTDAGLLAAPGGASAGAAGAGAGLLHSLP